MRIGDQLRAMSGQFGAQIAALIAGKPKLVRFHCRIRPANHFKLKVGNNAFQRHRRMFQKVLIALASRFLTAKENKDHGAFRRFAIGQRTRQLQNGGTTGSVIVGAFIDFTTIARFADAQVVHVSAQQDDLVFQLRIAARQNSNDVPGVPFPASAAKPEITAYVLDESIVVPARFHAHLGQFGRQICCGYQFITGPTSAALKRITGQKLQLSVNVVEKCPVLRRLLAGEVADKKKNDWEQKFNAVCQKKFSKGLARAVPRQRNCSIRVVLPNDATTRYIDLLSMHNSAVLSLGWTGRARLSAFLLFALLGCAGLSGCRDSGSRQEYAYVAAPEAVLRDRVAAAYTKTGVLHNGERVVVLERMTNRRFARVRSSRGEEGWVQERYLTDQETFEALQKLAEQFNNAPAQAVAETRAQVNLHVAPGRKTEHLYQLNENVKVDLLERKTVDKNAVPVVKPDAKEADSEPPTGEEATPQKPGAAAVLEDWWLVRDAQKRVGWVLRGMLYVDAPIEIAQYAEGHRIVAFCLLDEVQDGDKKAGEYLMLLSENKDGLPYDYDQARVFTWNLRRHRYETAFRDGGLTGFLPVTVGKESFGNEGNLRTFTLQLADEAGTLHEQKFKFNPPIVRQVLAAGEKPLPKVKHKVTKAKGKRAR